MKTGALSRGRANRLRTKFALAVTAVALLAVSVTAGSASAAFTATGHTLSATPLQAGGHPAITVTASNDPIAADANGDDLSSLLIDLPAGLNLNPQAVPTPCPTATFNSDACASSTQVGTISVTYRVAGKLNTSTGAVYSLTPDSTSLINFGFVIRPTTGFQKFLFKAGKATGLATVRQTGDADYGLSILVPSIPRTIKSTYGTSTNMTISNVSITFNPKPTGTQTGKYFTYAPTRCTAATSQVTATSYAGASAVLKSSITPTGCDQVTFDPSFSISTSNPIAGQSTGVSARVSMDTADRPIQQSHVSDVAVWLETGTKIDTVALGAVGLCSDAQLASDTCPAASKLGTASVDVPFLPAPMTGEIFLTSRDGVKFGYILRGARGTTATLRGSSQPVSTGNGEATLLTTFQTLPQVPWSSATMNFTAPVIKNPANACPSATAWADITGYSGSESIYGAIYNQTGCAPDTTLTTTVSGTTNKRTPAFAFTSTAAGATFECSIDSAAFAACSTPFTTPSLADGAHTFAVRAVSGGTPDPTPATASFRVDATPPTISIASPTEGAELSSPEATLEFTTERGATNVCAVDSESPAICASPKAFANLTEGPHRFIVIAVDAAGNSATLLRNFNVALPKDPIVTITSPVDREAIPTDKVTPRFTSVSPNGVAIASIHCTVELWYPEQSYTALQWEGTCADGQTLPALDATQTYRLKIDATDVNGRVGSAEVVFQSGIEAPKPPSVNVRDSVSNRPITERTPTFRLVPQGEPWPDRHFDCSLMPAGAEPVWTECGTPEDLPPFVVSSPLTNGGWTLWTRTRSGSVTGPSGKMSFTVGDWTADYSASTTTQQAGAHPDLDVQITPTGAGLFHTVDMTLPKGLIGSLNSFPQCDDIYEAICPASTKVGTVDVNYTIWGGVILKRAPGDVYFTGPQDPGDVGGLVIRVYGPVNPYADVIIPLRIQLVDNAQTMRVFSDSIPTVVGNVNDPDLFIKFWVKDFKMHINGSAGSPFPLLTNPSRCAPGEFTANFGDTEENRTPDKTIPYQANDCASLPFAPTIAQTFPGAVAGGKTGVITDVTLPEGNSTISSLSVAEPPAFSPNYPSFGTADDRCPGGAAPDQDGLFDPNECKPSAVIGNVSVESPLLTEPLTGSVYLINKQPLPYLGITLSGQGIYIRLYGETDLTKVDPTCGIANPNQFCQKRITVVFRGIPDLPLSSIHMELNDPDRLIGSGAMASGKLFNVVARGDALCKPTSPVDAVFSPSSGGPDVTSQLAIPISGC